MKKGIIITRQNFSTIAFRIQQWFLQHKYVSSQGEWGKYPRLMNKLGLYVFDKVKHVEKTVVSQSDSELINFRIDDWGGLPCLFMNPSKDQCHTFKVGDKIRITPGHIFHSHNTTFNKTLICKYTPHNNSELVSNYLHHEQQMSEMYWTDVLDRCRK